jgi:hypothetical protein
MVRKSSSFNVSCACCGSRGNIADLIQSQGNILPRVRPAKFVHVVYRTRRYEQMLAWYRMVFDARIQHQNPARALLTYDDEHHRFAFANLAVLQPGCTQIDKQGPIGVDHVDYT